MDTEYSGDDFRNAYRLCFSDDLPTDRFIKDERSARFIRELIWHIPPARKDEHNELVVLYNKVLTYSGHAAYARSGSNPFVSDQIGCITTDDLWQAITVLNKSSGVCNVYKAFLLLEFITNKANAKSPFMKEIAEGFAPLNKFLYQMYITKLNSRVDTYYNDY